jgi:hypothetical protein
MKSNRVLATHTGFKEPMRKSTNCSGKRRVCKFHYAIVFKSDSIWLGRLVFVESFKQLLRALVGNFRYSSALFFEHSSPTIIGAAFRDKLVLWQLSFRGFGLILGLSWSGRLVSSVSRNMRAASIDGITFLLVLRLLTTFWCLLLPGEAAVFSLRRYSWAFRFI